VIGDAVSDVGNHVFRTGQPVWVTQPDGSTRPAEYVGQATSECLDGWGMALVIYVDASEHDAVDIQRLQQRAT
jgi:hypothetical protein